MLNYEFVADLSDIALLRPGRGGGGGGEWDAFFDALRESGRLVVTLPPGDNGKTSQNVRAAAFKRGLRVTIRHGKDRGGRHVAVVSMK